MKRRQPSHVRNYQRQQQGATPPQGGRTFTYSFTPPPPTFLRRISLFVLTTLTLLFALAACEGGTITIEETDDGAVVRTSGLSAPGTPEATGTPGPTPTPRPRIAFPPESDGAALTALFDAANGESWQDSNGWLYLEDLGQWHGVTTDAAGRVTGLDLRGNGLSGELPEELGSLGGLTELDLRDNGLGGALPTRLADLTELEGLYLSNNRFTGALPAGLVALTALTDLYLHDNQFSGELPPELGSLPNLDSITIGGNNFLWADSYPPGMLADLVGLSALHASAGGDDWADGANWVSDPSVAAWSGVSVDGAGRVTGLDLSQNGLSGELPPALGNLAGLTRLDLSGNQLSGELPAELGRLTALTELHLHSNRLEGTLPAELGSLTGLNVLRVDNNQLDGALPAELGALSGLEELHLHSNRLSGQIPATLGGLAALTDLWLHDNQFSGELPPELSNLAALERVSLWGNQLSWAESYPPGILADQVALVALYQSAGGEDWADNSNWLTGEPVDQWRGVTAVNGRVTGLDLRENLLSGELPPALGNLANLETLVLWNNELSGEIPPTLGRLTGLTSLDLDQNRLSGPIPPELGNLTGLEYLGLWGNQLSGAVPTTLGNLVNLEGLALNDNRLSGELPAGLSELPALERVYFWGNQLTWAVEGYGPGRGYAPGPVADMVALVALYQSTGGEDWANNSNWQSFTPIGEWNGVTTAGDGGRVTGLDLSGSGLNGKLPPALGNLASLERLILNDNQLSGPIPPELARLTKLTHLHLNDNGLSGAIPAQLQGLASLKELNLASNRLSGPVPAELGNLTDLTLLYLDNNQLSGELPSELGNIPNLSQVSVWDNNLTWADSYANGILADTVALVALYESALSSGVGWGRWLSYEPLEKWRNPNTSIDQITVVGGRVTELIFPDISRYISDGGIPPELGLLTGLRKLDLSNNPGLTGPIPPELGNLTRLTELLLNDSAFSGPIPPELGNLTRLTELLLNDSAFSGPIPPELGNLSNLKTLNLASNRLSGPVPAELGNLTNLTLLYLDDNQLSGALPSELGNIPNLQKVSVWDNNLTWASSYANGILADTVALVAFYESALSGSSSPWRYWLTYEPLDNWSVPSSFSSGSGELVTVAGGRVTELNFRNRTHGDRGFGDEYASGSIPPELGLLTGLRKLDLFNTPGLTGCIPASLRGVEYEGDLPFCN